MDQPIESPIITKLRALLMGSNTPLTALGEEQRDVQTSSDTAHGYADGGQIPPRMDEQTMALLQSSKPTPQQLALMALLQRQASGTPLASPEEMVQRQDQGTQHMPSDIMADIQRKATFGYADGGQVPQPRSTEDQLALQLGKPTPEQLISAIIAQHLANQAKTDLPNTQIPSQPTGQSQLDGLKGYSNGGLIDKSAGGGMGGFADGGLIPSNPGIPDFPKKKTVEQGYADGGEVSATNPNVPGLPGVPELPGVPRNPDAPAGNWDQIKNWVVSQSPTPTPPVTSPVSSQASQILQGGPEARQQLAAQLAQRTGGDRAALLGGGIGDAIVRAAGKGDPGYAASILGQQNRREDLGLQNFDKAAGLGKEQYDLQQQLEAKDPMSQLSKQAQNTYGALLQKSGFSPDVVAKMPASMIADLTGKSIDQLKAEAEALNAKALLGLKQTEAQANIQHQKEMEGIAKGQLASEDQARKAAEQERNESQVLEAAKEVGKQGPIDRLVNGLFGNPGIKTLENKLPVVSPSNPFAYQDPEKEARYQAWKKSQGK